MIKLYTEYRIAKRTFNDLVRIIASLMLLSWALTVRFGTVLRKTSKLLYKALRYGILNFYTVSISCEE